MAESSGTEVTGQNVNNCCPFWKTFFFCSKIGTKASDEGDTGSIVKWQLQGSIGCLVLTWLSARHAPSVGERRPAGPGFVSAGTSMLSRHKSSFCHCPRQQQGHHHYRSLLEQT